MSRAHAAADSAPLITGELFPNIQGAPVSYQNNLHVAMMTLHPQSIADAMKGVFWGFLLIGARPCDNVRFAARTTPLAARTRRCQTRTVHSSPCDGVNFN